MRLYLPFPPPWRIQEGPNEQFAAVLPGAPGGAPAAVVTYGPIVLRPDVPKTWIDQVLRFDAPSGTKIEIGNTLEGETVSRWPLALVDARFVDAKGATAEARLCAIYTFMEHAAVAIARAADVEQLKRHAEAFVPVFEHGRPDWRGDPICLAEAWDLAAPARGEAAGSFARAEASFRERDFAAALAGFEDAAKLAAADLEIQRRRIRCLYALERFDEGESARGVLRRAIATSTDPRARLLAEYVFDQFAGDGFTVDAIETLRPQNPLIFPVLAFRAMRDDRPLPAVVVVETSEQARAAGTPFVLAAHSASRVQLLGASKDMPPYAELKRDVMRLLTEAVREAPSAPNAAL